MAGYKRKKVRKGKWAGTWEFRLYRGLDPIPDENGDHRKIYATEIWPPAKAPFEWDTTAAVQGGKPPGERLAEKALAAWVTKLESKGDAPGTSASLGFVVGKYLELLLQLGRSPTTLAGYKSLFGTWIYPAGEKERSASIGAIRINELTPADIRRFHARMLSAGRSNSRIRQAHAVIQGALGMALEEEWIDRNVATFIKRPEQRKSDTYCPEPDEVDRFFREAGGDNKNLGAAIALGATLGRRLGELCAIRLSDVDFGTSTTIQTASGQLDVPGTVRIDESAYVEIGKPSRIKDTKTHSAVTIPAGELMLEHVRARLRFLEKRAADAGTELVKDPYLLSVRADGAGPPRPDAFSRGMTRLRDRLKNPEMHFHCLRHFVAVQLLDAGVDMITIAQRLGWADASMLAKVYANHRRAHAAAGAANVMGGVLQLGSGEAL